LVVIDILSFPVTIEPTNMAKSPGSATETKSSGKIATPKPGLREPDAARGLPKGIDEFGPSELACSLPGCPPNETVILLMITGQRLHQFPACGAA
jgi:hypothetical protein